jgi:hypothetical protein
LAPPPDPTLTQAGYPYDENHRRHRRSARRTSVHDHIIVGENGYVNLEDAADLNAEAASIVANVSGHHASTLLRHLSCPQTVLACDGITTRQAKPAGKSFWA